jgi:hypothetical protein
MATLYQIPADQPITLKRGDDFNRLVTFTDDTATPINITSYTLSAAVVTLTGDIPITITPVNLTLGQVNILLTDSQTALIPATGSTWYFKWTITDQTRTVLEGVFYIV